MVGRESPSSHDNTNPGLERKGLVIGNRGCSYWREGMSFLCFFVYIVCGALASSVIGGACVVAFVSPEFVSSLFGREVSGSLLRYAAGVGMICGIFLGTAAMAFSLLLVTLIHYRARHKKEERRAEPFVKAGFAALPWRKNQSVASFATPSRAPGSSKR